VPNRKKLAKQARLDERASILQAQIARERRTRNLIVAGFAVLIIGGGLTLYFLANPPNLFQATFNDTSYEVASTVRNHISPPPVFGQTGVPHSKACEPGAPLTPATYDHKPPSSGPHYPTPFAPRPGNAYKDPVPPQCYIHDLEHGAVVLLYRCGASSPSPSPSPSELPSPEPSPAPSPSVSVLAGADCSAIFDQAFNVFQKLAVDPTSKQVKFLSTPYRDMKPKFALLAWGRELDMTKFDETTIIGFYDKYHDKLAPENGFSLMPE
jgi:hypothetical protein